MKVAAEFSLFVPLLLSFCTLVQTNECLIDQLAPSEISTDPYALHTVKGPFNRAQMFNLNITSNDDRDISYQLTTTAQNRLKLSQESGIIPPRSSQIVEIIVESFDDSSKTNADLISIEYTLVPVASPPSHCLQVVVYKGRKIIRIEYSP